MKFDMTTLPFTSAKSHQSVGVKMTPVRKGVSFFLEKISEFLFREMLN